MDQTTHQHVFYVLLSRSTCRSSSDHSWKSVVCKGKMQAFHTLGVVFKTRHTQCGIFCMLSPFFFRFWQSKLPCVCGLLAATAVRIPRYAADPPQPTVTFFNGTSSGKHGNATVWLLSTYIQIPYCQRDIGQDGKRPYLKTCDTNLICWRRGNNLDLAFWKCLVRTSALWPMCPLLSCRLLLVWCTGNDHRFLFLNPPVLAYQFFFHHCA